MKKSNKDRLKMIRKDGEILGVCLDSTSRVRVLRKVRDNIGKRGKQTSQAKFYIVTPNPEIVMLAQVDGELRKILNKANLKLPDGVGLAAADKFLTLASPKNILLRLPILLIQGLMVGFAVVFNRDWLTKDFQIVRGREMFLELIKLANKKGWRVFLFGGRGGVARKTATVLRRNYKKVQFEFAAGPELDNEASPVTKDDIKLQSDIVESINKFKPNLLFVALGAPKQEKWVYRWLPKLDIGGAMVVGGAYDYVSGMTKLPLKWMESIGLEWLWRLFTQPSRIGRIITASILFPLKVFWDKWVSDN